MRHNVQVTYLDRKGAGCMRSFPDRESCQAFISKLRCIATVRENGEEIGKVEYRPGDADDSRVKWIWWIEA